VSATAKLPIPESVTIGHVQNGVFGENGELVVSLATVEVASVSENAIRPKITQMDVVMLML
jgi:hypothetical protein